MIRAQKGIGKKDIHYIETNYVNEKPKKCEWVTEDIDDFIFRDAVDIKTHSER